MIHQTRLRCMTSMIQLYKMVVSLEITIKHQRFFDSKNWNPMPGGALPSWDGWWKCWENAMVSSPSNSDPKMNRSYWSNTGSGFRPQYWTFGYQSLPVHSSHPKKPRGNGHASHPFAPWHRSGSKRLKMNSSPEVEQVWRVRGRLSSVLFLTALGPCSPQRIALPSSGDGFWESRWEQLRLTWRNYGKNMEKNSLS